MRYQAIVRLQHRDGEPIAIQVTGRNATHVAHLANSIRRQFGDVLRDSVTLSSEREFWDFWRDLLGVKRST